MYSANNITVHEANTNRVTNGILLNHTEILVAILGLEVTFGFDILITTQQL